VRSLYNFPGQFVSGTSRRAQRGESEQRLQVITAALAVAKAPCATRSQPGAAAGVNLIGDLLSAKAITAQAAVHATTQNQVSAFGECNIKSTTPKNTKMGGAATASSAMYFAFRCAAVGKSNSASGIAINSDAIGIAKARIRLPGQDSRNARMEAFEQEAVGERCHWRE